MRALLQKNFLQLTRNLPIMFFCFASPVLQICVFCLAIGRDPSGLKLAIANMEVNGTVTSITISLCNEILLILRIDPFTT